MPSRHVVVLSDLHLWQTTDGDELWMRYRHRRFRPDPQLAMLFALLGEHIPPGELELVLNGDIFDFDVPPIHEGQPTPARSPRREPEAVARLRQILADHTEFLLALARLLLLRHRVIFVIGNHDLPLHFAAVQDLLRQQLLSACRGLDTSFGESEEAALSACIEFHPWFYRSPLGIHIEHGHQYDPYCSVGDPVWPFHVDGSLYNTVGTLVLEHLIGRLGYFNPNVESSFLLTTRKYLEHWLRYYWRSPRSLMRTFFFGALRILYELLAENGLAGRGPRLPELQSPAEAAHSSLFAHWDVRATLRILCLDRMLLGLGLLCAAGAAWFSTLFGCILALSVVGLYRHIYPQRSYEPAEVFIESQKLARRIARLYGVRAVVFGHSHEASGLYENGVFYGNSGTWAPMHADIECTTDLDPSRPVIWLRDEQGRLQGGLYGFHAGRLHPITQRHTRPAPPTQPALKRPTTADGASRAKARARRPSCRAGERAVCEALSAPLPAPSSSAAPG